MKFDDPTSQARKREKEVIVCSSEEGYELRAERLQEII